MKETAELPEDAVVVAVPRKHLSPPLFALLQKRGGIADDEMLRAFNMGVGLIVCVDAAAATEALDLLRRAGESPTRLGRVVKGDRDVRYQS